MSRGTPTTPSSITGPMLRQSRVDHGISEVDQAQRLGWSLRGLRSTESRIVVSDALVERYLIALESGRVLDGIEEVDGESLPQPAILENLIDQIAMLAEANLQPGWAFDAQDVARWLGYEWDVRAIDATLKEMGHRKLIRVTTFFEGEPGYAPNGVGRV